MNNHYFFYVCCIHEYCWNRCISSDNSLIVIRAALLALMVGLCIAEAYTESKYRLLYGANLGVYLTTLVTVM